MGSITQDGVFTSGGTGSSGTITATAGGLTSKVTVGLENGPQRCDPGALVLSGGGILL